MLVDRNFALQTWRPRETRPEEVVYACAEAYWEKVHYGVLPGSFNHLWRRSRSHAALFLFSYIWLCKTLRRLLLDIKCWKECRNDTVLISSGGILRFTLNPVADSLIFNIKESQSFVLNKKNIQKREPCILLFEFCLRGTCTRLNRHPLYMYGSRSSHNGWGSRCSTQCFWRLPTMNKDWLIKPIKQRQKCIVMTRTVFYRRLNQSLTMKTPWTALFCAPFFQPVIPNSQRNLTPWGCTCGGVWLVDRSEGWGRFWRKTANRCRNKVVYASSNSGLRQALSLPGPLGFTKCARHHPMF